MIIKKILREIVLENITLEEYNLGDVDTILAQKIRMLDVSFKKKALERVVSQYYYNHFNKLIMEENVEEILPLFVRIKEEINSVQDNTNYIFLNVNPASNIELLNFLKIIEKSLKKKWIKSFLYVIEQRGETEEEIGKGFHTHIIIEKEETKSYSQAIKELARAFSGACDTSNLHFFNGSKIKQNDLSKRKNYILGRKADSAKWKKQDMDIIFRKEYFLKNYYGNFNIGESVADK